MIIQEDKKGAKTALLICILVFIISLAGYFYYDAKGAGIFAILVSGLCSYFCFRKINQDSYICIEDGNFSITKGNKNGKFYFGDIKNIYLKKVDTKKDAKIIMINFKKRKLKLEIIEGLLQRIGDNEVTILTKYEKTIDEICKILTEKLNNFNEKDR